jgi:hypothetical protein
MNPTTPKVLHVNSAQEANALRNAIARILFDIQAQFNVTHQEIAETIEVSLGTISNAAGKKGTLSPTFLQRLGDAFGPEILNPYAALIGARMVPLEPNEDDPMPHLLALATALCQAKAEGRERDHRVKLAMVPDLKAAQAAITNMILQAEAFRA